MTSYVRRIVGGVIAAVALFGEIGCSLNLTALDEGQASKNTCGSDSDCPGGFCWSGMCSANQGSLSGVLIQVTPPTSVASVGGTQLSPCEGVAGSACVPKNVFTLAQSSSDFKLHLPAAMAVKGYVLLDDAVPAECQSLRVTLIPLEQSFGLSTVSYVADAVSENAIKAGSCPVQSSVAQGVSFQVNAAPGQYDIYVEPAPGPPRPLPDGGAPLACNFVPRLFREVPIATTTCVASPRPKVLNVKVQWPQGVTGIGSLQDWTVDIVHPTTGQLLSERKIVPADGQVAIAYSEVAREDSGQDLVRLTPPSSVTAPTVQFVRSGLEALSTPTTPTLGPFPAPVRVQGFVYRAEEYANGQTKGVPSTITMTATKIPGIPPGIFATYTNELTVTATDKGEGGQFDAEVVPGDYRVRVVPHVGLGLAAIETTLSLTCDRDPKDETKCVPLGSGKPPIVEAGKTLLVPRAATVTGSVAVPYGGGKMDSATVQASPAAFGKRACTLADGGLDAGGPDSGCAVSKLGVLEIALGESGFVPRAVSTSTIDSSFVMNEVDCGGCGTGLPAYFDFSVRTPDGSRFPWFVRTGVEVEADVNLRQLVLPLPIVQQGVVDILNGPSEKPTPVPGALVSAYVIRNDQGAYVRDPTGMKSCTTVGSAPQQSGVRCIRSVLQVAETRAANDGSFELVLPSSIE